MVSDVRRRVSHGKSRALNLHVLNTVFGAVCLLLLACVALLPDVFTVVLACAFAAVLSIGLPELVNSPAKFHASIVLGVVSFISIILFLYDTAFLTISFCLAFGLFVCFVGEMFRFENRDNLLYSISVNVVSMVCVVGAIAWIIFTNLYSWHFYLFPLGVSVMVSMLFVNSLRLSKGFMASRFKTLLGVLVSFVVSFVAAWIVVRLTYLLGYQLYVTSAVLVDSSIVFNVKYVIPILYASIIGVVSVGYSLVEKSVVKCDLKPNGLYSLLSISLIPISLLSMPTYMLLRIIGG